MFFHPKRSDGILLSSSLTHKKTKIRIYCKSGGAHGALPEQPDWYGLSK